VRLTDVGHRRHSEELKRVPIRVDALLQKKHYLLATKAVLEASKQLESESLNNIGALTDLRRSLALLRNVRLPWFGDMGARARC